MAKIKTIGILTSGGDAPGMNAAIRAVTRAGIYNGFQIKGIYRGYDGLINGEVKPFTTENVSGIIMQGGTILKTARSKEFMTPEGMQKAYDTLVKENIDAFENTAPLTQQELEAIDTIRRELGTQFCRRCNYCQPCTAGISMSGIFVLEGYLERYGLGDWARQRYAAMEKKAGDCVGCGVCETRCPYQLPIRDMLKRCKEEFGA